MKKLISSYDVIWRSWRHMTGKFYSCKCENLLWRHPDVANDAICRHMTCKYDHMTSHDGKLRHLPHLGVSTVNFHICMSKIFPFKKKAQKKYSFRKGIFELLVPVLKRTLFWIFFGFSTGFICKLSTGTKSWKTHLKLRVLRVKYLITRVKL